MTETKQLPKKKTAPKSAAKADEAALAAEAAATAADIENETLEERIAREVDEKLSADSDFMPIVGMSGAASALDVAQFEQDYTIGGRFVPHWVNKGDKKNYDRKRSAQGGYKRPSEIHPDLDDQQRGELELHMCRVETRDKRSAEVRARAAALSRAPAQQVENDPNITHWNG